METKETPKEIFKKENRARGIRLPDFRLYYNAIVIKTVQYWHKNGNIDEQNRRSSEIIPCTYGQRIYDDEAKAIKWKTDILFNKWCRENWTATHKKLKLYHSLTPYTKIKSNWIKDLILNWTWENFQMKIWAEQSLT